MCSMRTRGIYLSISFFTINTGQDALSATLSLTLPRSNSFIPPKPRLPMTIRSDSSSLAFSTILSAGLPVKRFCEAFSFGLTFFAFF